MFRSESDDNTRLAWEPGAGLLEVIVANNTDMTASYLRSIKDASWAVCLLLQLTT
ncbi:hypothetical protein C2845_PM13G01530 [Panicum miliaceum]|uniref:Uncharacterized protein n=1 Tax=Panicum miliaceum TaxID=4540 RepID=A0A3L6RH50_PANMI|nr:hypothetical protein C2845_PM13G01530 [Panicum miliaceum]